MKDSNTSLTIRTKVASSNLNNNSISTLTPLVRTSSKFGNTSLTASNPHNNSNNSDDEFELPLGNLIIDLDADIEKSNERLSSENESHFASTASNSICKSPTANLGRFESNSKIMSTTNSKTIRDVNNGTQTNQIANTTQSNQTNSKSANQPLQSTSDNSLKLKIKRNSMGGKSSESNLEIVQSSLSTSNYKSTDKTSLTNLAVNNSTSNEVEKKHHSSRKNKNSSHKEKKEKKEKKDKNSSSSSTKTSTTDCFNNSSSSTSEPKEQRNSVVLNLDKKTQLNNQTHDHLDKLNQIKKETLAILKDASSDSPPFKRSKNNDDTKSTHHNSSLNGQTTNNTVTGSTSTNKVKPETRSVSTATNVSTMTEPECLGFCEPGSAICLEGITWVEAEGVLVVNVTWRGKSYVGTLLDCTRHDWGPPHPRLCDSPTSDLESKGLKSGRGKRARSSISEQDSRLFQSKLRNGKGRRNNFTVPASPLKVDQQQQNKRNNRNGKETNSDKSNPQSSRNTPTPTLLDSNSSSVTNSPLSKQPNSPTFIECPEPNCCKKYKHINGLKYHQTHAHSNKVDDLDDTSKELIATDTEDMEIDCVENSLNSKTKENCCNEKLSSDNLLTTENSSSDKRTKLNSNCDKLNRTSDDVQSPAYSDISDVNENSNGNELNESPTKSSSITENHHNHHHSKSSSTSEAKDDDSAKIKETAILNNDNDHQSNKECDLNKNESIKPIANKEDNLLTKDQEDQLSKSSIANNGLDKSGLNIPNNLTNLNSNPPQPPTSAMNPNQFQFPFNMLPNPHYPIPMMNDPALHAYLMQQDRLIMDEQQKQLNDLKMNSHLAQQHKTSLSPQLMNSQQSLQQQQQQAPPPHFNQSASNSQQQQIQNRPSSSPYDFIHHEKQQQELLKLNRNAEERFLNKNSLGNLSSPKQQQPPSTSVQQMFGQHQPTTTSSSTSNNNLIKDEQQQRTTPKQLKDEGMKATTQTQGPPPAPTNSFYPLSPFLGPQSQFGPLGPQGLPFDPNSPLFRAQQVFNQNAFMSNLRFPLGGPPPQLPMEMRSQLPPQLPGQDMNSKLMNSGAIPNTMPNLNGNKKAYEMLQQVSQQYNLKEMQDKMLISPNSVNKNGLPGPPVSLSNNSRQSNHPGGPPIADPYGALIKHASSFPK